MHGRLKVRTTEEERERKKKEQALKVRAYRAAMEKIQKKRQNNDFDEELLLLTRQILLRNPDVSTLWNIRRECVLAKLERIKCDNVAAATADTERETDAIDNANKESIADMLVNVYNEELVFTEQCLMVNPKSYNCWHHRCWTLEQNSEADWDREVQLCNKYLKLDERNFHTWDYRRYVTEKAGVAKESELDYCTEKIKVNFSNYSSWHHRSLLLPVLYPYEGKTHPKRPMSEIKLKEELEMVMTAAFTDPNDSSAWFYQRWLLGGGSGQADLAVAAFRCNARKAVLVFTKPTDLPATTTVEVLNANEVDVLLTLEKWKSSNGEKFDSIWITAISAEHSVDFNTKTYLSLKNIGAASPIKSKILPLSVCEDGSYFFQPPSSASNYTPEVLNELQSQLESCMSLLEFEPDSKWTLLTSALLMRAIDPVAQHDKSLEHLKLLEKVDSLRAGYYKDLASKWALEQQLSLWAHVPAKLDLYDIPQLQSIHYMQYLAIADEVKMGSALEKEYRQGEKLIVKTFNELQCDV